MRRLSLAPSLLVVAASVAGAQEAHEKPSLMSPNPGLMVWTLVIFAALFFVLKKFAFPPILSAVEAREKALEDAIEGAKRDRDEAARLLAEQRAQLDAARGEAQKLIVDARATAERMRAELIEQTHVQQQEMLDRARRDIDMQKDRAIADLRREAVDLAIAGAGKVIERNLDDAGNRQLVEQFLASIPTSGTR